MKIYWYAPDKIFKDFKKKEDNPSFRLRCLNTHNYLINNGYHSHIVNKVSD